MNLSRENTLGLNGDKPDDNFSIEGSVLISYAATL